MKHRLSILAVLMMVLTVPAMAQNKGNRTDPDHATHSITGTMRYNDGKRYLNNAVGRGIQFEYMASRLARPTDSADLSVRFDSVYPPELFVGLNGKMRKLDFWRYDEEVGEWIYDSEVRQGKKEMESTMKTNIMLVIDNSKSLKGDFPKVQEAAIEFVNQLYRASGNRDIFRVGVIGFSTVQFTKVREITPLDASNYSAIVSFIRSLEMQNGTAFYYSLENALNKLEADANAIGKDKYKESRIYAFTDGLDQASVDDARGLSTPTKYFDHIKPMMKGSRNVHSTIVTVRGDDMTDGQERLFDQRAQEICNDVRKLDDMSKLVFEFKKLAEDLVNSNFILYCYIPVGASGRVGWTFADENVKVHKEKSPRKFWMGLGLEAGFNAYTEYEYGYYSYSVYHGQLGYAVARLDAAWPLSGKFALGGTLGVGASEDGLALKLGPIAKITFKNRSALLLGLGINASEISAFYLNVGWKFKSPWYLNAGLNIGDGVGVGFGVGYSIVGGK